MKYLLVMLLLGCNAEHIRDTSCEDQLEENKNPAYPYDICHLDAYDPVCPCYGK